MDSPAPPVGRLAPSPTGHLHLGNAWALMLAWLAARAAGGTVILRLEDIDPQRSRASYAQDMLEDLRWLGLDWDYGPDVGGPAGPYVQSQRQQYYTAALQRLHAQGLTYPCFCTRRELRLLAAAPHLDDRGAPYPGTCRHLTPEQIQTFVQAGRHATTRLRCAEGRVQFSDALQGHCDCSLADCGGDFALRRSDGVVAYQLAVVVDDALMGVTQVVRGRDILPSTPRQIWLQGLLGYPTPSYAHIPLLLDAEGQRLAKRHASLSLRSLREQQVHPEQITGLLAFLAGASAHPRPLQLKDWLAHFRLSALPAEDIRLDAGLLSCLGLPDLTP